MQHGTDNPRQAQVPVLAYKEEQPPALSHSVYESLVCNEFLEVNFNARSICCIKRARPERCVSYPTRLCCA